MGGPSQGLSYAGSGIGEHRHRAGRALVRAGYETKIGRPPHVSFPVTDPDVPRSVALPLIADTIPDRIAIEDGADHVAYAELVRRVNRAAITIVDVPGHHLGMLRAPVVDVVADALREALA